MDWILENFYQSTLIPCCLYENNELVINYDPTTLNSSFLALISSYTLKNDGDWIYTLTKEQLFIGYIPIKNSNKCVLIGPTTPFKVTQNQIESLLKSLELSLRNANKLSRILNTSSRYTADQSKSFMTLLDFLLNNHKDSRGKYVSLEHKSKLKEKPQSRIPFVITADDFSEKELLSYIQYGRPDLLEQFINKLKLNNATIPFISTNNTLDVEHYLRKLFISGVGTASRAAVRGGLDHNTMAEVTSYYLDKIDTVVGAENIGNLIYNMILEFAQMTAKRNQIPTITVVSNKIKQIIFAQINEKITPTLIAEIINMDVSYICRHFKKETGMTISSYINHIKIQECQRLLEVTDMSILDIATHLSYSTPNYMTKVFKNIVGIAPIEYRIRTY